jgi:hypothetical protein
MNVEARALVSVEEYVNTSDDPDCNYVDGELVERNAGEFEHRICRLKSRSTGTGIAELVGSQ